MYALSGDDPLKSLYDAAKRDPKNDTVWVNLLEAANAKGDRAMQRESLIKLIALSPSSARYRFQLGEIYREEGRNSDALRLFDEVLEIAPTHAKSRQNIAEIKGGVVIKAQVKTETKLEDYILATPRTTPTEITPELLAASKPLPENVAHLFKKPTVVADTKVPNFRDGDDFVASTAKLPDIAPEMAVGDFATFIAAPASPALPEPDVPTPLSRIRTKTQAEEFAEMIELQEACRGWNWGAFLLPIPWMICHQLYMYVGIYCIAPAVCFAVPFVPPMIQITATSLFMLIASTYLGIKGNTMGMERREFHTVADFKKVQVAWAKWAAMLFLVQNLIWGQFFYQMATIKVPKKGSLLKKTMPADYGMTPAQKAYEKERQEELARIQEAEEKRQEADRRDFRSTPLVEHGGRDYSTENDKNEDFRRTTRGVAAYGN
jgi:hypothetical protein